VGVLGTVIAAMLAAEMSTDSGYLLTWATVIYNDLVMPCLQRPLPQWARLLTIRALVLVIGVFLVFYGLWYQLPGAAWDYLAVTGNIYLASVFSLLVGALYWRTANRWGAMAALVLGAVGPITFLIVNAVVEEGSPYRIAPAVAGLSAFGLAFGGMFFGSLLGHALGCGGRPARLAVAAGADEPQKD
jgi:SSS family solute:Na+ symporter